MHNPDSVNLATKRWSQFVFQVDLRRRQRQLCLLPMVLSGFPDRERCHRFVEALEASGVSLVEIVDPVSSGWAATTNATIRAAHQVALKHARAEDGPELASRFPGTLKVLYAGNLGLCSGRDSDDARIVESALLDNAR